MEFFRRAAEMTWRSARIAAFGATRKAGTLPEKDANLLALLDANTPVCTVFGKTWTLHVTDVLRTTLEENLRMIEDSVAFLIAQGKEVIYDAEHYFDGYRADPDTRWKPCARRPRGPDDRLVRHQRRKHALGDRRVHRAAKEAVSTGIGIHTHNDANARRQTLAAVREGAVHVQERSRHRRALRECQSLLGHP